MFYIFRHEYTFAFLDAGKSTIGGHIMYLTGMVEKRTLEKYEREAKEKNRESWLVIRECVTTYIMIIIIIMIMIMIMMIFVY